MIKEHISFFRKLEMLVDLALAAVAFYLSCPHPDYLRYIFVFLAVWIALLYYLGMYRSFRMKYFGDVLLTIWAAAFLGVGIFGSAAYLFKWHDLSRGLVILTFCGAAFLTSIEKIGAMIFFRNIRKNGYNFRNILIVGTGRRAQQFIDLIKARSEWGLKIVGLIDEDISLVGKEVGGFRIAGTIKDVPDIAHDNVVDEIICIVPRGWLTKIEEVIAFCETEGIRVHVAIDMFDRKFATAKQTELENFLLLSFERTPIKVWQLFIKGVFDMAFSGVLLILLSPLFLITAIAIKLTSPGPVFFGQIRCGMNGRKFKLYKFRTMVVNAEALQAQLQAQNEMTGPVFKMQNDPRITPLGRFLRKFSIDELPQLWNVFKRDMSIVGPRPPLPDEVKKYDSWQRRRLSMRPGITCLWQVMGRNKITDFNEWTRLDLQYIDQWSMLGDFKILLQTVPVVLFGIGAK